MKRRLSTFIVVLLIVLIGIYGYSVAKTKKTEVNMTNKILITYYSHSGNTKYLAEMIQNEIGGDIAEIIPVTSYSNNYNEVVEIAKVEKSQNFMPELKPLNKNLSEYDTIFVGTPVWWYTMSSPIRTFLVKNNFEGKTIVPFCTHGGGGASSTYTDMKTYAPNAEIKTGFTVYERDVNEKLLKDWLKSLNL